MMGLFKRLLSFLLAYIAFSFLLIALLVLALISSNDLEVLTGEHYLSIDLSIPIVDQLGEQKLLQLGSDLLEDKPSAQSLQGLLRAISQAAEDDRIKGILLKNQIHREGLASGWGTLYELRRALIRFKQSGKPIISWQNQLNEADLYLLSVADRLVLHPLGHLEWNGLAAEMIYFKEGLDRYGVQAQAIRVGDYKSAVEPFIQKEMSPENRQQLQQLLADLEKEIVQAVAQSRHLSPNQLQQDFQLGLLSAQQALQKKYIDALDYARIFQSEQEQSISIGHYLDTLPEDPAEDAIALIYLEGEIALEGQNKIQPDKILPLLQQAEEDESIKAVVLRINSPGGEVNSADSIYEQARHLAQKKPLVISMGSLAASGGYWIAMAGERIYASPNTITGSIGVFGLSFNIQELMQDFGLHPQVVKTAPSADMFSLFRPKSAAEIQLLQKQVDQIYQRFIQLVAEARHLAPQQVEALAQGRIWSGQRAKQLGLVDEIGGLQKAIQAAARQAGLQDYKLLELEPERDWLQEILFSLEAQGWSDWLRQNHVIFARMPYLIRLP